MAAVRRWLTVPNGLSLLRLLLLPALVAAIHGGEAICATLVFAAAVATDFADGHLARRMGQATPLGGFLDHGVDAVFVTVGLSALSLQGLITPLLPPMIALAFLQYAIDSFAAGHIGLRGSSLGRWNGIAYYVLLAVPLVRDALGLGFPGAGLVSLFAWGLVVTTGLSMLDRLRDTVAPAPGQGPR